MERRTRKGFVAFGALSCLTSALMGADLPSPSGLEITGVTTNKYHEWCRDVSVKWSAVEGAGVYAVRFLSNNLIFIPSSQTNATVHDLPPGRVDISVQSRADVNNISPLCSPIIWYTNTATYPWNAPEKVNVGSIVLGESFYGTPVKNVNLSWPAVAGVKHYRVSAVDSTTDQVCHNDYVLSPQTTVSLGVFEGRDYRFVVHPSPFNIVENIYGPCAESSRVSVSDKLPFPSFMGVKE